MTIVDVLDSRSELTDWSRLRLHLEGEAGSSQVWVSAVVPRQEPIHGSPIR